MGKDNPGAANTFILELHAKAHSCAQLGLTGIGGDALGLDTRAFTYRDQCFYFRVTQEALLILRVVHGRQDIAPEDFTESSI
ncbi:type II toxin-antitoxin system RelE/ParE family toxin [Rhizobium sp. 2YAF20]|uniref:type II toxin-antitoxin system RelE/ParE family toxin n=1 Tax=Rhizobium sp. 2YAF20 TaxID=3233027 RepID=UPI003F963E8C